MDEDEKTLEEITTELNTVVSQAIEQLAEDTDEKTNPEEIDGTEVKEISESKDFAILSARIKSKSENVELQEDLKTLTVRKGMTFSNVGKRTPDDYRPNEEELAQINSISGIDHKSTDVYSFTYESADDQIDRQNEAFDDPATTDAAAISRNKAFLIDHSWDTEHHLGTIYAAVNDGGILKQKVFVIDMPENQKYLKNMMGGVYNKVSVGFAANLSDMHCMSCADGKSIYDSACPHTPGAYDEKGMKTYVLIKRISDFYELSLVPIPAQRNAGLSHRSLAAISETQQAWDKTAAEKAITPADANCATSPEGISKKVDTISSGNTTLGDETVPDTTTLASTTEVDKAAEGYVAVTEESAGGIATNHEEMGEALAEAARGSVEGEGMEGEMTPSAPAPQAPVYDKGEEQTDAPKPKKEMSKAAKKLTKALKEFKATVQELKDVASLLKSTGINVSILGDSQKSLETKLEALTKFVEAATAVTFENLERSVVTQKQISNTPSGVTGNQWAEDMAKGILAGGK